MLTGEASGADISPLIPARVPFAAMRVDASRYFDIHHSEADCWLRQLLRSRDKGSKASGKLNRLQFADQICTC